MSLTRTSDQIVEDAFSRLGEKQAGQDLAAEDILLGRSRFQEVLAYLAARRVVYIGNPDAIELAFVPDLGAMLALHLLSDYPADTEAVSRLPAMSVIESNLRSVQNAPGRSRPVRAQYF